MSRPKRRTKIAIERTIDADWIRNPPLPEKRFLLDLKNYSRHGEHGAFVKSNLPWLIKRCRDYRSHYQSPVPVLSIAPGLSREQKEVLYNLYKSQLFKNIDEFRTLSAWDVCPYCGLRNAVTLDHYLPRKIAGFPHLSFFSLNLVPSCSDCQPKKKDFVPQCERTRVRWIKRRFGRNKIVKRDVESSLLGGRKRRITNPKRFIHPYFDSKIKIHKIGIAFDCNHLLGPENFRIVFEKYRRSRTGELIKFHFRELEVESRLVAPFRKKWNSLTPYLQKAIGYGKSDLPTIHRLVVAQADQLRSNIGLFSMEAKFLDAVAADENCLHALRRGLRSPPRNKPKKP